MASDAILCLREPNANRDYIESISREYRILPTFIIYIVYYGRAVENLSNYSDKF